MDTNDVYSLITQLTPNEIGSLYFKLKISDMVGDRENLTIVGYSQIQTALVHFYNNKDLDESERTKIKDFLLLKINFSEKDSPE